MVEQIITFEQLKPGDQFQLYPRSPIVYLKIFECPMQQCCCCLHNAIDLREGLRVHISDTTRVTQLIDPSIKDNWG